MMKSYLVSFTSNHPTEEGMKVNNVVLVHAETYEDAVKKILEKREKAGMPLSEDDVFSNATIE